MQSTQHNTPRPTPRTSRDLFAEARRYENWARNIRDGRTGLVDTTGREWTLHEIYAHVAWCRRAGDKAYAAERIADEIEQAYAERAAQLRQAPPPYRAGNDDGDLTWGRTSDDGDLTWGIRGATGHMQGAMQFRRAA